jgi:amino acid transporter
MPSVGTAMHSPCPKKERYVMAVDQTTANTKAVVIRPGLRTGVLGFPALLAQSVALISPTMTAVLIIPLAFSDAGQGTWLAYLFGTVMLFFVVMNLNQFARRSASAGSMYAYTARGLGPAGGVLSGWTLLWSYAFIAIAGLSGFSIFANEFLASIGIHVHIATVLLFAVSAALCFFVAYKDIRISSILTLVLEAVSVALILGLSFVVLFKHGISVDTNQLRLKGVGLNDMNLAVVVCIFSLVGFESATALGGEAKNPFRNVPRAVVWSLIITGLFFVFVSYVEVAGTAHSKTSLADLSAPLDTLADLYNVGYFKAPISLGATVSFFSLSLSCINAGSRILYPMAQHGIFPHQLGRTHPRNLTPHVAIAVFTGVVFVIPSLLQIYTNPLTTFGDAGTLAAFGFLLAYFMISVAAPVFLRKRGELTRKNIAVSVLAIVFLLVPTVGSFYPVPPFPVRVFPYYFLAYMLVGLVWLRVASLRRPGVLKEIEADLELPGVHQPPAEIDLRPAQLQPQAGIAAG